MDALAVIIGALIALAASLLISLRSERWERRSILIAKLQDIHTAADDALAMQTEMNAGALRYLFTGQLPGPMTNTRGLYVIHTLVALYFPELDSEYATLQAHTNAYVELFWASRTNRPTEKPEQKALGERLNEASSKVRIALRNLQGRTVVLARQFVPRGANRMNDRQKVVLVVGAAVMLGMIVYLPWVRSERGRERSGTAGSYSWIFSPPNKKEVRRFDYAEAKRQGHGDMEIARYLRKKKDADDPALIERSNYLAARSNAGSDSLGDAWLQDYVAPPGERWHVEDRTASVRVDLVRLALQFLGVGAATAAALFAFTSNANDQGQ